MKPTTILPDEALAQHLAIVGTAGAGKTFTAKGFVERLLDAKRRVCILDPTDAWWGLRSSADGKREGYPVVVFGGEHADVPINPKSGPALAEIIATKNVPAIISLSEMLIGERHRFVTDFAEALHRLNHSPLHLVIDEADEFCPQNPMPESKRMLHQVDRIVRRGRIRGFRVMLITQRPAVVNKNVLTQVQTLIALRLTSPQDRKAIDAWVQGQADAGQAKEVLTTLAKLKRGEGWVWYPGGDLLKRTSFPAIRTFDSSRTPDDDAPIPPPTKLAAVDLREIRETFKTAEADDKPKGSSKPTPTVDVAAIANKATAEERARWVNTMDGIGAQLHSALSCLESAAKIVGEVMKRPVPVPVQDVGAQKRNPNVRVFGKAEMFLKRAKEPNPEVLPEGEALTLAAIAQYPDGVDRSQLSALTGYKRSTRDAYIQRLAQRGCIEVVRGGIVEATKFAHDTFGPFEPLPTGSALLAYWLDRLPQGEREVLRFLAASKRETNRADIDEATGFSRSTRDAYVQRLAQRKLVWPGKRGTVRAADILFD